MIAVGTHETMSPVVKAHTVLATTRFGPDFQRLRIKRKITTATLQRRAVRMFRAGDRTADGARRTVNPIVRPPVKTIDQALHIGSFKTGKDQFIHVGLHVAIGILQKEDIRGGCDKHAVVRAENGRRPA